MAECIEREAVLSTIWKTSAEHNVFFPAIMLDAIKAIPAADVVPVVHGRWVKAELDDDYVTCSNCKKLKLDGRMAVDYEKLYNDWGLHYCPNCGARMDGEA